MAVDRDTLISPEENRAMFDRISRRYDRINRLISLGLDRGWRRRTIDALAPVAGERYLDAGTGTGDLAQEIARRAPGAKVDGLDPAESMLEIAREKARRAGLGNVRFFRGDVLALEAEAGTYAGAVFGFSLRNVADRRRALVEVARVLKPGGRLAILEAVPPSSSFARPAWRAGLTLVALAGRLAGGGSAYRYLADSILAFPPPREIEATLREAGFASGGSRAFAFGGVRIFRAVKLGG